MLHRELWVGPEPAEVRRAREWVSAQLTGDWVRAAPAAADTVVLLVSELVTNAVIHGCGPAVLRLVLGGTVTPPLRLADGEPEAARAARDLLAAPPSPVVTIVALRLEVADRSSRGPRRRAATHEETGGRGLELVELLADRWGWRPEDSGKRVWCELPLPLSDHHRAAGARPRPAGAEPPRCRPTAS